MLRAAKALNFNVKLAALAVVLSGALAASGAVAQTAPVQLKPAAPAPAKPAPAKPAAAKPAPAPAPAAEQAPEPAATPDTAETEGAAGGDQAAPAAPAGQPTPDSPQAKAKAAAQEPPKQLVGNTTGWVRVCQKVRDTEKEGCSIKEDVVAENGAFLASMAVQEVTGEQRRQLIVTTPLGMAIQAGLLVRIDSEKAVPAKFGTCLVNGCFAGLDITPDVIDRMKKGKNAFITVRNIQGAALDLTVPLTSFGKAYDGPAMDVQALQEQQKKLQEELLKRAEKAREELLKQQGEKK